MFYLALLRILRWNKGFWNIPSLFPIIRCDHGPCCFWDEKGNKLRSRTKQSPFSRIASVSASASPLSSNHRTKELSRSQIYLEVNSKSVLLLCLKTMSHRDILIFISYDGISCLVTLHLLMILVLFRLSFCKTLHDFSLLPHNIDALHHVPSIHRIMLIGLPGS